MQTITATQLKQELDQNKNLLLINALDPEAYAKQHIPHSRNVPNSRDDAVDRVTKMAERKDRPIVVYCSGGDCKASLEERRKLEKAGFTSVSHFPGGTSEWKKLGNQVETGAPAAQQH